MTGSRFYNHKVLGLLPFRVYTGLMPRIPIKSWAPDDSMEFEFDASTVQAYVNDPIDLMVELCKSTID